MNDLDLNIQISVGKLRSSRLTFVIGKPQQGEPFLAVCLRVCKPHKHFYECVRM